MTTNTLKKKESVTKGSTHTPTKKASPLEGIIPEEIFTYLGEKFVVRTKTEDALDEEGNKMPKEFITAAGKLVDGWVQTDPIPELYRVEHKEQSHKRTKAEFGRALNISAEYVGPLSESDVSSIFSVEGKPIVYENTKLAARNFIFEKGKVTEKK